MFRLFCCDCAYRCLILRFFGLVCCGLVRCGLALVCSILLRQTFARLRVCLLIVLFGFVCVFVCFLVCLSVCVLRVCACCCFFVVVSACLVRCMFGLVVCPPICRSTCCSAVLSMCFFVCLPVLVCWCVCRRSFSYFCRVVMFGFVVVFVLVSL